MKLLVVDDEPSVRKLLKRFFEARGYDVAVAENGLLGWTATRDEGPDLVVSDVAMPEMDGYELVRTIRRNPSTATIPVILLSAHSEANELVAGYESGADDYVTKPVSIDALLARVRALLRRTGALPTNGQLTFYDVTMDLAAYRVQRKGRPVHPGRPEFRLLKFLLRYPRRVFSREELLHVVWGPDVQIEPRTVDVHIRRLRQAITSPGELDLVRTVPRVGYMLDAEPV